MRTIALLLVAAVLAPAVGGCSWFKNQISGEQVKKGGPVEPCPPESLVYHWNVRAERLQSLQYEQVRVHVSGKDVPGLGVNLEGSLVAAQGHNFRMTGQGRALPIKMDLGSNPDQFWLYLQAPGDQPRYVYASHADFQTGKARMPGGIPFDPDWVLQSFGLLPLSPANQYDQMPVGSAGRKPPAGDAKPAPTMTVPRNEKDRTYTLSWPARTPTGQPIRKEIVFDADPAVGTRPQVRRHVIKDAKGNVVATAEVKAAKTIDLNGDPQQAVQYPTHVVLKWTDPRFEMDLVLDQAQVNRLPPDEARRLFTRRDYPNVDAVDMASLREPVGPGRRRE
jgi:hypothetical protein